VTRTHTHAHARTRCAYSRAALTPNDWRTAMDSLLKFYNSSSKMLGKQLHKLLHPIFFDRSVHLLFLLIFNLKLRKYCLITILSCRITQSTSAGRRLRTLERCYFIELHLSSLVTCSDFLSNGCSLYGCDNGNVMPHFV
jgi:hypothetical protein